MKKTWSLLLLLCVTVATASAQGAAQKPAQAPASQAAASMPTADEILAGYVEALGGKAAVEKITSRFSKGTLEIPSAGATGSFESYEKFPNKSLAIIVLNGFGEICQGFDGTVAWSQDPQSGLREKNGVELASVKRDSDIHKDLKLRQLYPKMEVQGKEKVGEKDAFVIVATPQEGAAEKWYFDTQTHLLMRSDTETEGPQGKVPVESYYEDYREVDGIRIPFTLKHSNPVFSIVTHLQEVKHNVPVEDEKFAKPKA